MTIISTKKGRKTRILLGILFVTSLLLLIPSNSALQLNSIDNTIKSREHIQTIYSRYLENLPDETPPVWFTFFFNTIMLFLSARILFITPLAITPSDEYWGAYDINSYVFFFILLTLVYRFAFWYILFDKIAERNNWELP